MKSMENRPAADYAMEPQGAIYRDGTEALERELAAMHKRHADTVERLRAPAEHIYATRKARHAAGWVLCGGMAWMVIAGLGAAICGLILDERFLFMHNSYLLTGCLLAAWPAAALTYWVTHIRARHRFSYTMLAPLARTGDIHIDLERARRFAPAQHALRALAKLEAQSISPLLTGVALLAPLTLHFFIGAVAGADIAEFDTWIALSGLIVGHCHLILAIRIWRYGSRVATEGTQEVITDRYSEGWKTYAIILATSLFPGVLLVIVPAVIVALTGLFIPALYGWAGKSISEERYTLKTASLSAIGAVLR